MVGQKVFLCSDATSLLCYYEMTNWPEKLGQF